MVGGGILNSPSLSCTPARVNSKFKAHKAIVVTYGVYIMRYNARSLRYSSVQKIISALVYSKDLEVFARNGIKDERYERSMSLHHLIRS